MAKFFPRKTDWKMLLSGIVTVVLLVGAVAGVAAIVNIKTKTVSALEFSVGGLDDQGEYLETKQSIYTKDLIECAGLVIEPDFETRGSYQVFYYDNNKNFVGKTPVMDAQGVAYEKGDSFAIAPYCRIVITPEIPLNEDGKPVKDFKIYFFDAFTYADDYKITVLADQNSSWEITGFSMDGRTEGKKWQGELNAKVSEATASDSAAYDKLQLDKYADELYVVVAKLADGGETAQISVIYTDGFGNVLGHDTLSLSSVIASRIDGFYYMDPVEIPDGTAYAYITASTTIMNMVVLSK